MITKEEYLIRADAIQIALQAEESDVVFNQINNILDYISIIDSYDCSALEELQFMVDDTNRLREDVPSPSLSLKDALANAPSKNENFFKVPKVIE
ncbi:MAG: Asp-tRNA(Asn)/Glu-tRNA(Gln) amidotransferase subunit GatC [Ignavibacteria bacterium]|nr:Asp-tRNA(Asn)/Glu-tRNA(Gln) amidotransferase subunit GatC [Ignavibacteria bacterium]